MKIKETKTCRICGNAKLVEVLDLGTQTLSGRFPAERETDPPEAPLTLLRCDNSKKDACGLLQLKHSVSPEEMYQHEYGYRSGINQTMRNHLKGITEKVEAMLNLEAGDIVLDIGSNDATLLKSYSIKGLRKVGIDPAGQQFVEYYTEGMQLVSDYFSARNYFSVYKAEKAAAITSIAMLYDLPDPMEFIEDIKNVLHPEGIWVFEQSYMPTMLAVNSFDTICHEHLEYYSLKQIEWMLERRGLRVIDVEFNDTNGGSFRVYACHKEATHQSNEGRIKEVRQSEAKLGLDSDKPYLEFRERILQQKRELCSFLKTEKTKGKSIYIYGASTKGNVLLQFYEIDGKLITAAADRNPEKWGKRTPKTRIPIISEEEARASKPDYFLVLPWHFRKEFMGREKDFLAGGGRFIFPLPKMDVIGAK